MSATLEIRDRRHWIDALTEAQEAMLGAVANYGTQGDELDAIKHLEEVKEAWLRRIAAVVEENEA